MKMKVHQAEYSRSETKLLKKRLLLAQMIVILIIPLLYSAAFAGPKTISAVQQPMQPYADAIIFAGAHYDATVPGLYQRRDLITEKDARHYQQIRSLFSPASQTPKPQIILKSEHITSGLAYSTQSTAPTSFFQCQTDLPSDPAKVVYICIDPRNMKIACTNC